MSHIRNLFHKPSGHVLSSPGSARAAAEEPSRTAAIAAVATIPEFAVEQAQIRPANRLIYHVDPHSVAADRFRFLRMRLREHWSAGKLKKLLIASPLAHDGKSTVLLNLATALAERGRRSVLVIEADLHHSSMGVDLKLNNWNGLTDCLQDESVSPLSHIRRVEPFGWHFLPAGEPRRNPTELLQTPALSTIIQKISACFDWVLIDSPPVLRLTDAIALQQHVDASLLVVRAGHTPREAVEHAISLLGKPKIVGIVLNEVHRRDQPSYQHEHYGGGNSHED